MTSTVAWKLDESTKSDENQRTQTATDSQNPHSESSAASSFSRLSQSSLSLGVSCANRNAAIGSLGVSSGQQP